MRKIYLKCPDNYTSHPDPFIMLRHELLKLGYSVNSSTTYPTDFFIVEHIVYADTNTVVMNVHNEKMLLDSKVRELLLEYMI